MKDMPIGKLMEAVKNGKGTIRYEVEIDEGKLLVINDVEIVFFSGSFREPCIESRALADAIRERCAG